MLPHQSIAPVNEWISLEQALHILGTLVGRNSIYLPTELKMKILESLSGVDIARVSCVCSEFRNLASDNDLWKHKCLEASAGFAIEEADLRDDLVDWKAKFVECWRLVNPKEPVRARRADSCNPFRDGGFFGARDRGRGGSAAISVRSRW